MAKKLVLTQALLDAAAHRKAMTSPDSETAFITLPAKCTACRALFALGEMVVMIRPGGGFSYRRYHEACWPKEWPR